MTPEQKDQFAQESYRRVMSAVNAAVDTSSKEFSTIESRSRLRTYFDSDLREILFVLSRKDGVFANDIVRLMDAVCKALDNGNISLSTADDVETLYDVLDSTLRQTSQVSEYYVKTGHLFEVMYELERPDFDINNQIMRRTMYLEIYRWELGRVEDELKAGNDPRWVMSLAPEIKVEMSGLKTASLADKEFYVSRSRQRIDHEAVFARYGYKMPWLISESMSS